MKWETYVEHCPSHESEYDGSCYCKLRHDESRVEDRLCLEKHCTPYWWAVVVMQNYPR
jgi:hypothetical protein